MDKAAVAMTKNKVKINHLINFDVNTKDKVKVSIVVPVCNVEIYLRECLDSVVNQTLKEIEIICVNDGSKDGCEAILEEYAQKDKRVKVIDKENAGYGHAMNIGMDMARGEYIGIVESDDYVDTHMYEELYQIAKTYKLDFVKCDFNRFRDQKEGREFEYFKSADKSYYEKIIDLETDKKAFKFNVQTWTGLYNATWLREKDIRHNETPGASFQDNGFYYKTFCQAKKIWFVNKGYYFYRYDNPNSSIHNKGKVDAIKKEFDLIFEYAIQKKFNDELMQLYYWKKFKSYLYTVERVGEDLKKEFFYQFALEFKALVEAKKIDLSYFNSEERKQLEWIIVDPKEYYDIRVKQQKLSVIIPVYNVEKYVEECLNSVVRQTLKEIEIICINDGSTDGSLKKLNDYKQKDKRICVYNQANKGVGATRNRGIDLAHGEFVIFMDPDDFYPADDVLEVLYANAKKFNVKISGGSFSDFINGTIKNEYKGTLVDYIFKEDKIYYYKDYQFDYGFHRFIYNTSMLRENKIYFPKFKRFQDPPFFISAMLQAEKFYGVNKTVYCYRRNSNSQNITKEKLCDALKGVIYDLNISKKLNYKKLHSISAQRLFLTFIKPIVKYLDFKDKDYVQLLAQVNAAIDYNLLDVKICKRAAEDFLWVIIVEELLNKNASLIVDKNDDKVVINLHDAVLDQYKRQIEIEKKLQELYSERQQLEAKIVQQQNANIEAYSKLVMLNSQNVLSLSGMDKLNQRQSRDLEDSKRQLAAIQNSFSYKVGRMITWLPRKIRNLIQHK